MVHVVLGSDGPGFGVLENRRQIVQGGLAYYNAGGVQAGVPVQPLQFACQNKKFAVAGIVLHLFQSRLFLECLL